MTFVYKVGVSRNYDAMIDFLLFYRNIKAYDTKNTILFLSKPW